MTLSIGWQPLALVVEGTGEMATRMGHLIDADEEAYQVLAMDRVAADRALREQRVAAVVLIPADFDARIAGGTGAAARALPQQRRRRRSRRRHPPRADALARRARRAAARRARRAQRAVARPRARQPVSRGHRREGPARDRRHLLPLPDDPDRRAHRHLRRHARHVDADGARLRAAHGQAGGAEPGAARLAHRRQARRRRARDDERGGAAVGARRGARLGDAAGGALAGAARAPRRRWW